jgi:hypothetical protein
MAAGSQSGDTRKLGEAIVFMLLLGVIGAQLFFAFRRWWPVFDKWFQRNPVTPSLLILGLLMCPVTVFLWIKSSGKRLGDEAEEIGRGMRR